MSGNNYAVMEEMMSAVTSERDEYGVPYEGAGTVRLEINTDGCGLTNFEARQFIELAMDRLLEIKFDLGQLPDDDQVRCDRY